MDHWKRSDEARGRAWSCLRALDIDVALLQESVLRDDIDRDKIVYRPIGGTRPWGNAVVALNSCALREVQTVGTKYSPRTFSMLGTVPGALIVATQTLENIGNITFVSIYGVIDVYAQTSMLRLVADLIPLFDSPAGEHVVLGGDFNITTCGEQNPREGRRYAAILQAVESLGLVNLASKVEFPNRPPSPDRCACRAMPCRHIATYRGKEDGPPVSQLDYLYATSALAAQCRAVRLADNETRGLSDHVPLIAEFEFSEALDRTTWDVSTFVNLIGERHGSDTREVVERIVDWARQKDVELTSTGARARMDRLPLSSGKDPELWLQLDLQSPEGLQYTFSVRADGNVVIQFQYLRSPFDTEESRSELLAELNSIPGVSIEARLKGRPTFPLSVLRTGNGFEQFLKIWNRVVDQSIRDRSCYAAPSGDGLA